MIGLAFVSMISGVVFGFAYAVISPAIPFLPDIDPLTGAGIGFSLGLGTSLVISALAILGAIARVALAFVLLVAPLLRWLLDLVTDPLGRRQRANERARIDRYFPPPSNMESKRHAQT